MTLTLRLEKLKFLVEEMQLAFHVAKHAPNLLVKHRWLVQFPMDCQVKQLVVRNAAP